MKPDWVSFYKALADAIAALSPSALYEKTKALAATNEALHYFHFDNESLWEKRGHKLDPFTVMGIFNRGQTDPHRHELAVFLAASFKARENPPTCFHGIPHLDPRNSIYHDADAMTALYKACQNGPGENFARAWDAAIAVHGNGLGTLSTGLFWVRPDSFMAVDRISDPFIEQHFAIASPPKKCSGNIYCDYLVELRTASQKAGLTYPEIACAAWQATHQGRVCP